MIILGLISDIFLLGATCGMAFYCWTLSRRLRAFNDLDKGIGGTVAALSLQVDQLQTSIDAARGEADNRSDRLRGDIRDADDRIGRLELLLAGLEDIETDLEAAMDPCAPHEDVIAAPSFRAARTQTDGRFMR